MFAKSIVLSDAFLDMPMSARCLYFTLNMFADDDGFVNNPKSITRQIGASEDDMKVLVSKRFVLVFESGVIVIKHWRINNYLRSDRYHETNYIEEKKLLSTDDNGAYTEVGIPHGIPMVDQRYTEDSIGKVSIGKDRLGNNICQRNADEDAINEVVDAFKEICISLPKPQKITETRKKYIRGKLKEYGIDTLKLAFQKMEASDFLSGRDGAWTGCSFDWIIQYKGNIVKVIEGNYDNKNSADIKAVSDMRKMTEGMTREEYEEMERTFK